jgi:hypothetical protein
LHQVEDELQDELKTNTAIKIALGTDHPDEALDRATSLFAFNPAAIKIDTRTCIGEGRNRHDSGQFQTYSPLEQREFHAGRILQLPMRHYLLKVRGEGDPIEVVTPTYHARYELAEAVRLAGRRRVVRLAHPDDLATELRWRWQWLDARGYQPTVHDAAVPTFGGAAQVEQSATEPPHAAHIESPSVVRLMHTNTGVMPVDTPQPHQDDPPTIPGADDHMRSEMQHRDDIPASFGGGHGD